MSEGDTRNTTTMRNAIQSSCAEGVVLVSSTGNLDAAKNIFADTICYPAAYPEVIGVGSVNSAMEVSTFSLQTIAVNVCAPGERLLFATLNETGRIYGSGTSFASPCVAATLALVKQLAPTLPNEAYFTLLEERAVDLGENGFDSAYGFGFLDLYHLFHSSWFTMHTQNDTLQVDGWIHEDQSRMLILSTLTAENQLLQSAIRSFTPTLSPLSIAVPLAQNTSLALLFQVDELLHPLENPKEYLLAAPSV